MEELFGLLLLCAAVAALIAVVRSMLDHWQTWAGCALGAALLLLAFNAIYYGLLGN
jgi:hypothetical protein